LVSEINRLFEAREKRLALNQEIKSADNKSVDSFGRFIFFAQVLIKLLPQVFLRGAYPF
jgi:hypothetical protein